MADVQRDKNASFYAAMISDSVKGRAAAALGVSFVVCFFVVIVLFLLCKESKREVKKTVAEHKLAARRKPRRSASVSPSRHRKSRANSSADETNSSSGAAPSERVSRTRAQRSSQAAAAASPRGRCRRAAHTNGPSPTVSAPASEYKDLSIESRSSERSRTAPTTPLSTVHESQYASVRDFLKRSGSSGNTMIIESLSSKNSVADSDYALIDDLLAAVDRVRPTDNFDNVRPHVIINTQSSVYESTSAALK